MKLLESFTDFLVNHKLGHIYLGESRESLVSKIEIEYIEIDKEWEFLYHKGLRFWIENNQLIEMAVLFKYDDVGISVSKYKDVLGCHQITKGFGLSKMILLLNYLKIDWIFDNENQAYDVCKIVVNHTSCIYYYLYSDELERISIRLAT